MRDPDVPLTSPLDSRVLGSFPKLPPHVYETAYSANALPPAFGRASGVGSLGAMPLAPETSILGRLQRGEEVQVAKGQGLGIAREYVAQRTLEEAEKGFKKSYWGYPEYNYEIWKVVLNMNPSAEEVEAIGEKIHDFSYRLGVPKELVVEALGATVYAGVRSLDEALMMLPTVIKTAETSGASFKDTAEALKGVHRSLGIHPDAYPLIADTILAGGRTEAFNAKAFVEYLPDVLQTAVDDRGYAGGLGLEQFIADLQTVNGHTATKTEVVERLNAFYSEFSSEEFLQRLADAGYDVKGALEDAEKAGRSNGEALQNLIAGDVLENPGLIPKLFPDKKSAAAAKAILLNPEEWKRNRPVIDDAEGAVNRRYAWLTSSLQGRQNRFKAGSDESQFDWGEILRGGEISALFDGSAARNWTGLEDLDNKSLFDLKRANDEKIEELREKVARRDLEYNNYMNNPMIMMGGRFGPSLAISAKWMGRSDQRLLERLSILREKISTEKSRRENQEALFRQLPGLGAQRGRDPSANGGVPMPRPKPSLGKRSGIWNRPDAIGDDMATRYSFNAAPTIEPTFSAARSEPASSHGNGAVLGPTTINQQINGAGDPVKTARAVTREQNRAIRSVRARALHEIGSLA